MWSQPPVAGIAGDTQSRAYARTGDVVNIETAGSAVFLGLSLDEELLRAEFEAIMAAEFPDPGRPSAVAAPSGLRRRSSKSPNGAPRMPGRDLVGPAPGVRVAGRQRSPPWSRAGFAATMKGVDPSDHTHEH